jgi:hypothetical protein
MGDLFGQAALGLPKRDEFRLKLERIVAAKIAGTTS